MLSMSEQLDSHELGNEGKLVGNTSDNCCI